MTARLQAMYDRAPVWVQELMLSGYGAWLSHLRYGGGHGAYRDALARSEWWSARELRQWQSAELGRVLARARRVVPWYRERLPDPGGDAIDLLPRIPLLTKEEARQARARLVATDLPERRRLTIHTSGTTGSPLDVRCDRTALRRNYAFFARSLRWAGVGPHPRVVTFAGRTIIPAQQASPPFWRRNRAGNALLCSSYHLAPSSLAAYADAIAEFRPELIDSYPSSLAPLARHLLEAGDTRIRPRAIVTSSETLDAGTRGVLELAFACRVFDQYGAAEMGAFISQCEAGSYHAHPEYGIVELLDNGRPVAVGETGEIVATGFVNGVMPFIRYATGDRAVRGEGPCRCGRSFPVLARVVGREDDVLVTPEGREIGRLDPVFKGVAGLLETRIVQDRADHLRVEVVVAEGWGPREATLLLEALARRVGPSMRLDLVPLPRLPRGPGGKLRTVVNEVRRGPERHAAGTGIRAGRG